MLTLAELFPDIDLAALGPFKPCYSHNQPMDQVIWLDEDLPYRTHRVHERLELLLHPHEDRVIGISEICGT